MKFYLLMNNIKEKQISDKDVISSMSNSIYFIINKHNTLVNEIAKNKLSLQLSELVGKTHDFDYNYIESLEIDYRVNAIKELFTDLGLTSDWDSVDEAYERMCSIANKDIVDTVFYLIDCTVDIYVGSVVRDVANRIVQLAPDILGISLIYYPIGYSRDGRLRAFVLEIKNSELEKQVSNRSKNE